MRNSFGHRQGYFKASPTNSHLSPRDLLGVPGRGGLRDSYIGFYITMSGDRRSELGFTPRGFHLTTWNRISYQNTLAVNHSGVALTVTEASSY